MIVLRIAPKRWPADLEIFGGMYGPYLDAFVQFVDWMAIAALIVAVVSIVVSGTVARRRYLR